ncbi:MAG TPA: hypothetical protein VEJ87_02905 [Acidimicrobiales bacterium]|nr:hypothetical protein [Acidimicrobiales bacterium]
MKRGIASAGVFLVAGLVMLRVTQPLPALTLRSLLAPETASPGVGPTIRWPTVGEAAVSVPALGLRWDSAPEKPVPIASITKVMTAYVVLKDHPLSPYAQGPTVVATEVDHLEALSDVANNDSSLPVQTGEKLTERQLLNGLIVHSADNFADMLARWDANSVSAFVVKMNLTARSLGMEHTQYVDANGLNPFSASTPEDQLRLAAAAMSIPTFAAVAGQQEVTLPLAGPVDNYVTDVGVDGVVGVKSGFTQAAMGCVILAAERSVGGRSTLVLAGVTGQPGFHPLPLAQFLALLLINSVTPGLRVVHAVSAGERVARISIPWDAKASVYVSAPRALSLLVWAGEDVRISVVPRSLGSTLTDGETVGWLTAEYRGETQTVPLVSDEKVGPPGIGWRFVHG